MSRFACVVLLPEESEEMLDFASREFDTIDDLCSALHEVDDRQPGWRLLTFCHAEDLPLLMEPPA